MSKIILNWPNVKGRITTTAQYLFRFLKNPLESMKQVPQFELVDTIILQTLVTIPSGMLGGAISGKVLAIFSGLIALPIVAVFFTAVGTLLLQYILDFIYETKITFDRLYLLAVLSSIPFLLLNILQPAVPPIPLVGLAFTALLLVVGLVETYKLPRKGVLKLVGLFYFLFFVIWVAGMIRSSQQEASYRQYVTPDTLEILDKEFK